MLRINLLVAGLVALREEEEQGLDLPQRVHVPAIGATGGAAAVVRGGRGRDLIQQSRVDQFTEVDEIESGFNKLIDSVVRNPNA